MWENLSQLLSSPNREIILSIATFVSSSILVIALIVNIKSYNKMRMTDQIKLAHDFFKDYRELKKESVRLHEQAIPRNQRMDWAEDYFDSLEWFAYLVNTEQIKNPRLIGMFKELIRNSCEQILPEYYPDEKERQQDNFYPELDELYRKLTNATIKVYHHRKKLKINPKKHSE
jgi:hypothetical protein